MDQPPAPSLESPPAWADTSLPAAGPNMSVEEHASELFKPYSTLDEPVMETILRDVHAVASKLKVVLQPIDQQAMITTYSLVSNQDPPHGAGGATGADGLSENDRKVIASLKDWDLWGPLILCLTLAVCLSFRAPENQASLVFASVFSVVWVGGAVVTINAKLLGSTISFFQCLCVLGYSVFPLTLSAFVIGMFKIVVKWVWFDMILVLVGLLWSIRVSFIFISIYIQPERRLLALYPVLFFYIFLSWMILLF